MIPPPPGLQAMEKFNIEKDIAAFIKKEFDKKYNPTWHCIVGRNFGGCPCGGPCVVSSLHSRLCAGSYVTHETKHFIYFYLGEDAWGSCPCAPLDDVTHVQAKSRSCCSSRDENRACATLILICPIGSFRLLFDLTNTSHALSHGS